MALDLICQTVIPYKTNLPRDVITNTWSFRDASSNTDLQVAADILNPFVQAFYDGVYNTAHPLYISGGSTWRNRWYDRSSPPPRVPYILPARTSGGTEEPTSVPAEAAVVLSFQGAPQSGQVQARRRGRIYLGALVDSAIIPSTAVSPPAVNPTFVTRIIAEALSLRDDIIAAGNYFWSVWSSVNNSRTMVDNGWVDNEIDTQRRRGVQASLRNVWGT